MSFNFDNQQKTLFKMDYQICFHDFSDEIWLIKPTSSVRSDRVYGNEFFAQNISIIESVSKMLKILLSQRFLAPV